MKRLLYLLLPLILLIASCDRDRQPAAPAEVSNSLADIKARGKLVVVTDYGSTDYFIYRGQPLGYQYEMLQELSNYLDVKLELRVNSDLDNSFKLLNKGEVDLIAENIIITRKRKEKVDFTMPYAQSRQVLVQRKPDNWRSMSKKQLEDALIRNPLDLAGKTVYVQRNSAHVTRLRHLAEEIGDTISIVEVDENAEQLIYLVSVGELPYTVTDEILARVNQTYFSDIDVETAVSFHQNMGWAVRKGSDDLLNELNTWMADFLTSKRFKIIYAKYFQNSKSGEILGSDYYAINTGKISPYDDLIRQYSEKLDWDWRLLASMIYQESRFKNDATSWAGAFGLMQLMPNTARRYGVDMSSPVRDQIRAGTDFIGWLNKQFKDIPDEDERVKFILAAYNIGPGHIFDARNLARKNGADPDQWYGNVESYLLRKSDPVYFNDPVVKYGYCRGTETFRYVHEVLERYDHYRNIVIPQKE
ncbi:MAG: transporter substrate-binding domain-containing protein [Bacteroidales bacterium]|nr:transporter substrate-binding domain-containing protein [Bacteroidales bacterium]MBN2761513.1 transporter substrate-binding domain-containing protein [Bacteroidales bacterium]